MTDPTGTKRKNEEETGEKFESRQRTQLPSGTKRPLEGETVGEEEEGRGQAKQKVEDIPDSGNADPALDSGNAGSAEQGDVSMEAEDTGKLKRVEVAEMYSVPRVTVEAKKFGLEAGEAMDLRNGWDFNRKEDQDRAMTYVRTKKPGVVIGSPMCTMFSQLQGMQVWNRKRRTQYQEAVRKHGVHM